MEIKDENIILSDTVSNVASNIFQVMPLIKKRLTKLNAIQSEHGLPLSHVQVLAMLEEVGSMSVSDISKQFGIAKPNITPLVDRLVDAGLVDRSRSETDRRVVNIVILEAGRQRLRDIQAALDEHVKTWQASLTKEEFLRLDSALNELITLLEKV